MLIVKIGNVDVIPEHDPYHRGQCKATSTQLKIYWDKNGEPSVCVSQDLDQGATPSDEWHGLTITTGLNSDEEGLSLPDQDALQEYLGSEAGQDALRRVVDNHTVEWDGHNHKGSLIDNGKTLDELLEAISGLPHHEWQLWNIEEYLYEYAHSQIDADTTDEQIKMMTAELDTTTTQEHIVLSGDVSDYLTEYRNERRETESQ